MKKNKTELLEVKDEKIEIKNPVEEFRMEETIDGELGSGKHRLENLTRNGA